MKFSTCFPSAMQHYGKALLKTILVMKLIVFFIVVACLKVSATVYGQNIVVAAKQEPIEKVFSQIEKQTSYQFWYKNNVLKDVPAITIAIESTNLQKILDAVFANQRLSYEIVGKTIVVKKKTSELIKSISEIIKSINVTGKVIDEKNEPIPGVNIKVKGTNKSTVSDGEGDFLIEIEDERAVLVFSYIGYKSQEIVIKNNTVITVKLEQTTAQLDGVTIVNTGYQQLPKERATGSFVQIDNELLNRRVSTNILDRLENIASGLTFNKNTLGRNEQTGISIRGRSTLDINVNANPLIIVDNFPYEGDLSNINPNDIENITILKDAASASIWGSRAGNGVIVLTTKKGKFNQPVKVSLNSNITVGEKPDLFYTKDFINSGDYIDAEINLFNQGFYNADINNTVQSPVLSPAIEILLKQRNGTITKSEADDQLNKLKSLDVRNDFDKYYYQRSVNQQYALNLLGGSNTSNYSFSTGFDKGLSNQVKNSSDRITLNGTGNFIVAKNLTVGANINYLQNNANTSAAFQSFGNIRSDAARPLFPYAQFADEFGTPIALNKNLRNEFVNNARNQGFLDWTYKPLDELELADRTSKVSEVILRSTMDYKFLEHFKASMQYQYQQQQNNSRNYQSLETFETRNLINRFSVKNASTGLFTYPVPIGGILDLGLNNLIAQNFRGQLNYNHQINALHQIDGIAGFELREIKTNSYTRRSYGYNEELGTAASNINFADLLPINPSGTQRIAPSAGEVNGTTNRYVSYFSNVAYTYRDKYIFSASGRIDGANIFGAATNDKITPLWSAGLAWIIDKEGFYNVDFIPQLKIRATYGYNGNVYNASSYLTATYATSARTGARYAIITSAPNDLLRWERVKNINLGVDFATKGNRISGTIELYKKDGLDLIENIALAPTSGFLSFKGNAASTSTKGIDININTSNLTGKFKWNSMFLFSHLVDKVTSFNVKANHRQLVGSIASDGTIEATGLFALVGKPLYGVYSYKWAGLDPINGDPQGYLNGNVSKDYLNIIQSSTPESIVFHGTSRPTVFGSIINSFGWKWFTVSANISYKLNYYFRKTTSSGNLQDVLTGNGNHTDYSMRWQKTGDEATTNIPSAVFPNNDNRSLFYKAAEINVLKADHVRLQDITVGYEINKNKFKKLPVDRLNLYAYANNLGILWRANNEGIDPDYVTRYSMPNPRTFAIGIKAGF